MSNLDTEQVTPTDESNATDGTTDSGVVVFRFDEIGPHPLTGEESFWVKKTPVIEKGFERLVEAGWLDGLEFRVLLDVPGFNLAYGRNKPGMIVPLHYHHGNAVYFITAGSAFYGNIELKAGDGLYQPANSPYTLIAGDEGLEIIEMRTVGGANTMFLSNSETYWNKILEKTIKLREGWTKDWPEHYGEMPQHCGPKAREAALTAGPENEIE